MIKVEGYPNLYRDEKTGAIVNCDKKGYEEYKRISNQKNLEKQELDKIKKDIDEIKTMLRQIING